MKELLSLIAHLLITIAKLLGPSGAKTIVADSLLMKQQLLIMNRARRRAPNLTALDRFLLGFWSLFLSSRHIQRAAVILRPSTLLRFHNLLKQRKYRLLYSAGRSEVISRYKRQQAIEDGFLVDLMQNDLGRVSRQHYKYPVACTVGVFELMKKAVEHPGWGNDYPASFTTSSPCRNTAGCWIGPLCCLR